MRFGGIVLCGGRSSRMGRPKAWLPVGDEPMLSRVVRILGEVVRPVVVVAAPGQAVPLQPVGVTVVRDEVEGQGPLGGLAAGLAALTGVADAVYLSACDVPLLRPAFVRRVVSFLPASEVTGGEPWQVAVPQIGGFRHPLAAAYRVSTRDTVLALLAADRRRTSDLFDAVPTRILGPADLADADPAFDSLRNVNTEDDYAAVLRDYNAPLSDRTP